MTAEVDGMYRTYCSEDLPVDRRGPHSGRPTRAAPPRTWASLTGTREWETLYHGWNWADVVSDLGYVRDDGKTMVVTAASGPGYRRRCGRWITCAGCHRSRAR